MSQFIQYLVKARVGKSRQDGNVSGLERQFAVVEIRFSRMFTLIRTVCIPWLCGQRMTGSAGTWSAEETGSVASGNAFGGR